MNATPLVLYHADMDGFAAACVVARDLGGRGEYRAVQYGDPAPVEDAAGRDVYVVDFSWPLEDMRRLLVAAADLWWIDHHKTSAEDAETLAREIAPRSTILHDPSCSGATLTWYMLRGIAPPPSILPYVQDRDLWQWRLPDSREVSAALALYWPRDAVPVPADGISGYEEFLAQDPADLVPVGRALVRAQVARVAALAERAETVEIDGRRGLAVNATGDISELGHYLCETMGAEVGVVYFREGARGWVHSLRSVGDVDVSVIAKARGGGGHKNAAGFTASEPPIVPAPAPPCAGCAVREAGEPFARIAPRYDRMPEFCAVMQSAAADLDKTITVTVGDLRRLAAALAQPAPAERPDPPIIMGGVWARKTEP